MLYGLASCPVDAERLGWTRLLAFLSGAEEDPRAGAAYERVRVRLIRFFRVRGATAPEELTDATFERLARKLAGADLAQIQPAYLYGVAQRIWRESLRKERTHRRGVDRLQWEPRGDEPEDEPRDADLRLRARCLDELDDDDRRLLIDYYEGSGQLRIARRQALVARLGINSGRLRARIHRLRRELERRLAELQRREGVVEAQ